MQYTICGRKQASEMGPLYPSEHAECLLITVAWHKHGNIQYNILSSTLCRNFDFRYNNLRESSEGPRLFSLQTCDSLNSVKRRTFLAGITQTLLRSTILAGTRTGTVTIELTGVTLRFRQRLFGRNFMLLRHISVCRRRRHLGYSMILGSVSVPKLFALVSRASKQRSSDSCISTCD